MNDTKKDKIALAVIKQLKGLSYHDAEQVLNSVTRLLKEKSTVG
jgi:hypothetical protein